MVVAEREEGTDQADEVAEQDVEAVVAEVEPARTGDKDGREPRDDADQQQVERRRGSLEAYGGHGARVSRKTLLLGRADAAACVGPSAPRACGASRGHLVRFGPAHGGHGGVMASPRGKGGEGGGIDIRAGGEEGNCDGELAGDEK